MNEDKMSWWVENVWTQRASRVSNPRFLLVLDAFTAHTTDTVKRRFAERTLI